MLEKSDLARVRVLGADQKKSGLWGQDRSTPCFLVPRGQDPSSLERRIATSGNENGSTLNLIEILGLKSR